MPTVAPSTLLQHTNTPRHRMHLAEHHRLALETPSREEMDGRCEKQCTLLKNEVN